MIQDFKKKLSSDRNFNELLRGSSITFVLKITGMLMSYLVLLLISRGYGTEGVGIYGLSNRIIRAIGIISALGFNVSVLRYVGEFNIKKNNKAYFKKIIKYFVQYSLPVSLIIGVFIFASSEIIAVEILENEDYIISLRIIAVAVPFFTLNLINVEFIRGLKLLKVSEYLRSVNTYLVIFIILITGLLSLGVLTPIYALGAGVIITFFISVVYILNHLKKLNADNAPATLSQKDFISTSMPMMTTTVSSFVLAFSSVFFLEVFSSTDIVGIFSICVVLSQLVSLVLTAINTISAPKFSELYWSKKVVPLKRLLFQSSKMIFWSSMFISIALSLGSELILSFFGEDFIAGRNVLLILIFGQIINAVTGSVGVFLNMTGHQKVLRNIILVTAFFVVLAYYIVVPKYGMIGAALVSVSGTAILNVVSVIYVYRKLGYVTFYLPFLKIKYE